MFNPLKNLFTSSSSVLQADNATFQELMKEPNSVVLDVRTADEFSEGHIVGAVNIDVFQPDFALQVSNLDSSKKYLVYCRSGRRSMTAIETMERKGFTSLVNLKNGIMGWNGSLVIPKK